MPRINRQTNFTAQHHAMLFTNISKQVIEEIGEENGEKLIRRAVRKYGRQRGKRMALRAQKNGHDLTVATYFAYGEWEVPKNEMKFKLTEKTPDARLTIFLCPWHTVWKDNNLLKYGKYFCQEIDTALVNGFNPDLDIKVNSTQTNGGELCDFIFKNANLHFLNIINLAYKKKINPGAAAIMPWEYHTGHLFKTLGDVIKQALDARGESIMQTALTKFIRFSSKDHIEIIQNHRDIDFDKLPQSRHCHHP